MLVLDKKYVFHIPLFKFEEGKLIELEIEDTLEDLIDSFGSQGLYVSMVKSHYGKRIYDELLVTLFTSSDDNPEEVFKRWFMANNCILRQEAFAYELDGKMYICEL